MSYEATILGKTCIIDHLSDGILFLADGQRFKLQTLYIPSDTLASLTLWRVSTLMFSGGQWYLDGEPLIPKRDHLGKYGPNTDFYTIANLSDILDGSRHKSLSPKYPPPAELQNTVVGVAWAKEWFEEMTDFQSEENPSDGAVPENEPSKQYQPIFLSAISRYDSLFATEAKRLNRVASKMVAASKNLAATGANTVTQIGVTAEKLRQISQPFREMYKDESMLAARHESLRNGVPELVIDTIVAKTYGSKFPTVGALMKDLSTSGGLNKLAGAGHGTSRAQVSRWLRIVRTALESRGLLERKRLPRAARAKPAPGDYQASPTSIQETGQTIPDTRAQELDQGFDDPES